MSNQGALANLDADAAIRQLEQGALLRQISAQYNCDKSALYRKLKDHPEYRQAIDRQAEALVEQATHEAMTCDKETVNIARVRVDAAHKWAAARDPARWAPKGNTVNVQINNVTHDQGLTDIASSLLAAVRLPESEQEIAHPLL